MTTCRHRFLRNLKRQHPELHTSLEPELAARYDTKKALSCFSQVKPSDSAKTLASVAQECFALLQRFEEHPRVSALLSSRLLRRAFDDQCQVKTPGEDAWGRRPSRGRGHGQTGQGGFLPVLAKSIGPGCRLQRP